MFYIFYYHFDDLVVPMISDVILGIEDEIKEEAEDVKVNQSNEEDPLKLTKDEVHEGKYVLEVKHLRYLNTPICFRIQ